MIRENQIIRVHQLEKVYPMGENSFKALDGVDIGIEEGEFCTIVGASGSGKSTLLNLLAGLDKPTKGEILICNERVDKMDEKKLVAFRRKYIGFIFQSFNLLPQFDAVENVEVPLMFQGIKKEVRRKLAIEMLERIGLENHLKHYPGQMSGGQQQRVGIARALVANPRVLFADEPTGNLDSNTTRDILTLLKEIVAKDKKTLVVVTHDPKLAALGDRQIRILDGKVDSIIVKGEKV